MKPISIISESHTASIPALTSSSNSSWFFSSTDNILTLHFDNHKITVTITKSKDAKEHNTNSVRIRTSGSEYDTFYQEFTEFYRQIWILEHELNKTLEPVQSKQEDKPQKLSLKNIFNPNKKN